MSVMMPPRAGTDP